MWSIFVFVFLFLGWVEAFTNIQPLFHGLKPLQRSNNQPCLYANINEPESDLAKYFVPGFVGVWAIGYTLIAVQQTLGYRMGNDLSNNQQLGESGGLMGVGLTVILFVALVGYAAFEVFKPDKA